MGSAVKCELPSVHLLEAGLALLLVDLPQDGGVERGVRRLAAGRGPELIKSDA